MRIDKVETTSAAGGQTTNNQPVDSVSKGIENEIFNVQRQMRALSSKEDISVEERMKKRQEYQREISRLNAQLRQRKEEALKEEQKEQAVKERQKEALSETKQTENDEKRTVKKPEFNEQALTDNRAILAANSYMEQAKSEDGVIARIEGGIAVLKGEINLDKIRGMDVEPKKEELAAQRKRVQKASASQSSVLGKARKTMQAAEQTKIERAEGRPEKKVEMEGKDRVILKSTNFSKEKKQEGQPPFYTSLGIHI